MNEDQSELKNEIEGAQEKIQQFMSKKRNNIMIALEKKLLEVKEQLKKEAEKKKENQYDFKAKEKELNEHLETMTQVAQKIDDDNKVLQLKNQDLKIQFLS